jgi:hypothetical protein
MHYLLKHKMLQFEFKCFFAQLLHVSVPLDHHQGGLRPHSTQCTHYKLKLSFATPYNNFNEVF